MLPAIRSLVHNIIVLIILGSFLQLILPSGQTRRYAQLAFGLVMVLTLLTPLVELIDRGFSLGEALEQAEMVVAWEELQAGSRLLAAQNQQAIMASYRQAVERQIQAAVRGVEEVEVKECQLELLDDPSSADYGRILSVKLVLEWADDSVQPVSTVKPVLIGPGQNSDAAGPASPLEVRKQDEVAAAVAEHLALSTNQVLVRFR